LGFIAFYFVFGLSYYKEQKNNQRFSRSTFLFLNVPKKTEALQTNGL